METDKEDKLRTSVVKGAMAIFLKGLVEAGEGNVSVRNGNMPELFITPSFNQYEGLTKDNVVHMGFDGTALSSGKLPSTETIMHTAIYKSRKKVKCVIHTHSTFATMLSIVRKSIPIIMEEQVIFLGGSIDLAPYGEAHTEEIGQAALEALGIKNGALLASHGVIVCGKSVEQTVKFAELIEKLAKVYWGSLQIGEPFIISEQLEKFQKMFDTLFANYPRNMKRKNTT